MTILGGRRGPRPGVTWTMQWDRSTGSDFGPPLGVGARCTFVPRDNLGLVCESFYSVLRPSLEDTGADVTGGTPSSPGRRSSSPGGRSSRAMTDGGPFRQCVSINGGPLAGA